MKTITLRFWVPDSADIAFENSRPTLRTIGELGLHLDTAEVLTDEQITKIADGIRANEYAATVTGIVADLRQAVRDGDISDRDAAYEWIEQTIDGHHDIIYTACAMEVLAQSRNDSAYFDELGTADGAVTDSGIEWSKLAFWALRADVLEELSDLDDWFKCSECGDDCAPSELAQTTGDDLPMCDQCREIADGTESAQEPS
jgi:hypothetical protein